jgi:hypothetical protein
MSRPRRLAVFTAFAFYLQLLLGAPAQVSARVEPLAVITRQLHKPNVLVVLDTSGSMVALPGGVFDGAVVQGESSETAGFKIEAGVDCDNGVGCRTGTMSPKTVCSTTTRDCVNDTDCRIGTCSTSSTPCWNDNDCKAITPKCSVTGGSCATDTDCPAPPTGTCSDTKETCSAAQPCPTSARCSVDNVVCTTPGAACPDIGRCQRDPTIICRSKLDCPQWGPGKCSGSNDSCNGDGDCASQKTCSVTNEACSNAQPCPTNHDKGYCSTDPTKKCSGDTQCKNSGGYCVFPTNGCVGPENFCKHPHTACQIDKSNTCTAVTNTCTYAPNVCVGGGTNVCKLPPSSSVCQAVPGTTGGTIRMCQLGQTVCATDADCPATGDTCGPATSRAVISKRVIRRVIEENYNVANFGLMTFWQSGYFPYFQTTSTANNQTATVFMTREMLRAGGCWDGASLPTINCTLPGGVLGSRRTYANSQYRIYKAATRTGLADQDYCGAFCPVKPGYGTGEFLGAYYTYKTGVAAQLASKKVLSSYVGQNTSFSGTPYSYYQSNPAYYNGGDPPTKAGFEFVDCNTTGVCGPKCGGRWDTQLAPFMNVTDDEALAQSGAMAISARMAKASNGGLVMFNKTPTGCTLDNDGLGAVANPEQYSVYHYIQKVKQIDPLPCRNNFVVLVTDGAANGPGDVVDPKANISESTCAADACAADDPVAAGCTCKAVLAAYKLRKSLNVLTFVVGFSADASTGTARIVNDNIAKAGGTDALGDGHAPYAFLANNEGELFEALQGAVFEAIRGSYSTSPATASSGIQLTSSLGFGDLVLDSRADFPSWRGHLIAYDISSGTPTIKWDAATRLSAMNWWERRVYVGSAQGPVRVRIDPGSKNVLNAAELFGLGLGASAEEAADIARWMLGDPTYKNPAILGAIINSTPIDVGQPGDSPLPGGHQFYVQHKDRPSLTYVGSNDGMLHAFFTKDTTIGGSSFPAGSEAFAYVPRDMLSKITQLYVQGGQKADPKKHIFGLANSAKVKNLCVSGCADSRTALWKTVLVMPQGWGGNQLFVLDVTNPFHSTGLHDPPFKVMWNSADGVQAPTYASALGLTLSVPAFMFNKTDAMNDYRLVFASGYGASGSNQGRELVIASATTGAVLERKSASPSGSCAQDFTLLSDVATARNYAKGEAWRLAAAYVGDTWGNLWRYASNGDFRSVASFGCQHPLHFAPTVVQLDRDNPNNKPGEIYVVQVTNSSLDPQTGAFSPSQMIILKDQMDANGVPAVDTSFGTEGRIIVPELCAELTGSACTTPMPVNARPASTPMAVLKADGSGFKLFAMWYTPAAFECGKGQTFLTIHDVANGVVTQKVGVAVAPEAAMGTVFVGGKVFVASSTGVQDIGSSISAIKVQAGSSAGSVSSSIENYRMTGWIELP